jgi:Zn-dependent M28 family amino/carboxypeptidase
MTASTFARRSRAVAVVGLAALAGSLLAVTPAAAAPPGCDNRNNNSVDKLLECVTVDGVREHQQALQDIADANGGNRASGLPGYDASVDYVVAQAEAAGLTVSTQDFDFPFFQLDGSSFAQTAPTPTDYVDETDYAVMTYSGAGDVEAVARLIDPDSGTSGCEAADFAGFAAGEIALLERGTCPFGTKVANAAAAGADAAVVYNNAPELFVGTLGAPAAIPAISTGAALGSSLGGATLSISVDAISENRTTTNVFAETTKGATDSVLMVGAHLDSVVAGPGINDNGSGSAAILEVASLMSKTPTEQTVRFAWWGAEELGLLGSEFYVSDLQADQPAELDRISAYLNFDMVGSPNFARFIYDGDDSDAVGAPAGPAGSAALEDVFQTFYTERGLAYEGTDFTGRSDYGPFIAQGVDIPSGGLFTGAEGVKTPEQAVRYGGTAGVAYDPCYHQACDDYANNSDEVLDQNADAIAYATFTVASTLEPVANPAVADTPGDVGSGGGLHEDHDHGGLDS